MTKECTSKCHGLFYEGVISTFHLWNYFQAKTCSNDHQAQEACFRPYTTLFDLKAWLGK